MCFKMNRYAFSLAAAASAVWLWAAPAAQAQWREGSRLPALSSYGLSGTLPSLAGKVVLVDFWASWCGPCRKSFPELQALSDQYAKQGLVVLGISVDEDAAAMREFLEKHAVTFPVARDGAQKLVAAAGVSAMPSSFVVDRSGVVRFVHTGFFGEKTVEEYRTQIESLLREKGASHAP